MSANLAAKHRAAGLADLTPLPTAFQPKHCAGRGAMAECYHQHPYELRFSRATSSLLKRLVGHPVSEAYVPSSSPVLKRLTGAER